MKGEGQAAERERVLTSCAKKDTFFKSSKEFWGGFLTSSRVTGGKGALIRGGH